nr:O-antigen ligase family protein [Maliibacterium massiliense]
MTEHKALHRKLLLFLSFFVLLQPLWDILTSMGAYAGHTITVGVIIRIFVMTLLVLYVLFFCQIPHKKIYIMYLAILITYIVCFLVISFAQSGFSVAIGNLKETIKVFYFPIILIALYCLYKEYNFEISDRALTYIAFIYAFIVFFAYITGTSFTTYKNDVGYKGWFYAGNELSGILSILGPCAILFSFRLIFTKRVYLWGHVDWMSKRAIPIIGLLVLAFCSTFIGTKAIFLCILLYLALLCLSSGIRWIKQKHRCYRNYAALSLVIGLIILGLFCVSPLLASLQGRMSYHYEKNVATPTLTPTASSSMPTPKPTVSSTQGISEKSDDSNIVENSAFKVVNWLLSQRLTAILPTINYFVDSDILTQTFGIGYVSADPENAYIQKAIEMDFISVLLRHGYLGCLLFITPLCWFGWRILKYTLYHLRETLTCGTYITYLYSVLWALIQAMLIGHTLVAPAVSIYVAILFVKLVSFSDNSQKPRVLEETTCAK